MIYQGKRLSCKNDQGYGDTTTRTQAIFVWFPEDTCSTFKVARTHAGMIKFHQNFFSEYIPFDKVHIEKIRQNNQPFNKSNT